jgi:Tol biopolymer transport system component
MVPTFSPDGKFIVYTSSENGGQLVRVNIDGSDPHVLTRSVDSDNPHVSSDSKWVIYSAIVDGASRIMRVPLDGGEESVLLPGQIAMEPRYSSDGTKFACFLLDEKTTRWSKLGIFAADGGAPITTLEVPPSTNASRGPVWTPDDKGITLVVAPGEKQNLWLVPVDGTPARALTNFDSPGISRRAYSHDGKRLAVVRAEGIGNAIMITNFR